MLKIGLENGPPTMADARCARPSEIANTGSIARLLRPGSEALCREADWHSLIAAAVEKKAQPDVVDQLAAALRMASDPAHGVLLLSVTCRLVLQTLAAGGDSTQALTVLPEPLDRFLLGRRVSGSPAASLPAPHARQWKRSGSCSEPRARSVCW